MTHLPNVRSPQSGSSGSRQSTNLEPDTAPAFELETNEAAPANGSGSASTSEIPKLAGGTNLASNESSAGPALGDTRPSSPLHFVINLLVSAAVLGAAIYGYTFLGERQRPQRSKPAKSPVTIVATDDVRFHSGPVVIDVNGVVVPLRELRLASEVAGRVVELSENVRAGRKVKQGEVLIRLDATEYELEVKRLQALAQQEAAEENSVQVGIENTLQLQSLAQKQLEIARQERERINALVAQRAASASEVDTARRAELAADASLVELENRRRELTAQLQLVTEKRSLTEVLLERARLDLSRCEIKSPIDGRVVSSEVEEQSFLPTGTTFITIEDTSAVEVRASLTADQMFWIWNSRSVLSTLAASDPAQAEKAVTDADRFNSAVSATISSVIGSEAHQWSAVFERLDGVGIDLNTRTYPCLFRVESPESSLEGSASRQLTRGMFVDVSIETQPNQVLVRVAESAVRPGNRLWLNVDGKLRIVPVTIVSRTGDDVVVQIQPELDHLCTLASTRIIVSPISDPVEGMPVGGQPPSPSGEGAGPGKTGQSDFPPIGDTTSNPIQANSSLRVDG
ncbi:efflux RND transporter periplasmic adaptor subunit [Rhodopirellula baltica]|uniref:efflux RND transporter periplasmic adaptor subunit n=1 Tax=Rhodopirellula baltica TaxID=265606 RepID=UPI0002FDC2CB|nr:biotin/lipoyl-binding protein [Rhodopirellula baltica]